VKALRSMRTLAAVVLASLAASVSRAADLVVISSTDPEIAAGTIVKGDQVFEVAAKTEVVLVASDGRTIKLEGPFSDKLDSSPEKPESNLVDSLSKLITERAKSESKLAVFRGETRVSLQFRPDIWGIDLTTAGLYCLRPDLPVTLWWESARGGITVTLSSLEAQSTQVSFEWPEGRRHQLWPRELPISDGVVYVARLWAEDEGTRLELLSMPELASDAHRAAWMADNGCKAQALRWVDAAASDSTE